MVFLLPKHPLPQLFLCPARGGPHHSFPQRHHSGHRQPQPRPGRTFAPGVHHSAGRANKTGLRDQRRQALAGRPAAHYATGNDTLLGDDLYAHQPFCRQALLHGFHFLFTCKPSSHEHLSGWVEALEPGRSLHTLKQRVKGKSNRWEHHQYRWANGAPLTDSDDALKVNWCEVTISDDAGQTLYRNSFITDWKISADNVAGLVAAGRARWKIENQSNNVLKTKGYHLEHNFGHGKQHLASLLATMNLLAFGLHTLLELTDADYRLIRAAVGARRKFFQHLEALTTYLYFQTWERLMDFMMRGLEIGPYAVQKRCKPEAGRKTRHAGVRAEHCPIAPQFSSTPFPAVSSTNFSRYELLRASHPSVKMRIAEAHQPIKTLPLSIRSLL